MNIRDAIEAFLLDHRARGSRPRTLEWHRYTLSYLLRDSQDAEVATLTVFVINQALAREVKPNTLANYERSLRAFCAWLVGVELLAKDPFKGRKRAKQVFEPKRVLTPHEISLLFQAAKADKRWRYRNPALLAVFLDSGLRASEVARLSLGDVDWETGVLKVEGKTGPGTVAIGRQTLRLLKRYVSHERKARCTSLFVHAGKPLSQPSLTRWARRLGERAGIGQIGCHTFRRTFATICTQNGMDFFSLQRAMRHKTPAMTQRYVMLDVRHVRQQVDRSGPLTGLLVD